MPARRESNRQLAEGGPRKAIARGARGRRHSGGFSSLVLLLLPLRPPEAAVSMERPTANLPESLHLQWVRAFPAPQPLNVVLSAIFGSERLILTRFNIPFGVSIMALARAGDDEGHRKRDIADDAHDRHPEHEPA